MTCFKWLTFLMYGTIVTYFVFLAPGRNAIHKTAQMIHFVPFANTIHAHNGLKNHSITSRLWFSISNFLANIILFIPFPILISSVMNCHRQKWVIGCGVALSILIERLQFYLSLGVPDIDDIILNTTGIFIGTSMWKLSSDSWLKYSTHN